MHPYLIFILAFLVVSYAVNICIDIVNLTHLKPKVPEEFKDNIDQGTYTTSLNYARWNTWFGIVSSTLFLIVLLCFLYLQGFQVLDELVRNFDLPPLVQGLLYMGILAVAADILSTPLDLFSTFVIEEKFGFNTMTIGLYLVDKIKMYLLALCIGGPLLAAVIYFFSVSGSLGWLYSWLVFIFLTLALQYLAPRYILPLFNTFEPLKDPELKGDIRSLAQKTGYTIRDIFIMDGSRRSKKSNAFFTGFGKTKRIALFDTLFSRHDRKEILAVLAHELGHYAKGHILIQMLLMIVKSFVLFYLLSLFIRHEPLFAAFSVAQPSVYVGLVLFFLIFSPVSALLSLVSNMVSRKFEYQADEYAHKIMGDSANLVSALKKLATENLTPLTPHPAYVFLHYSHPPVLQRIRALSSHPGGPD